eukprot:Skav210286  [mRNA]  locus=scaffold2977:413791:415004:+ [translate_table: standard]
MSVTADTLPVTLAPLLFASSVATERLMDREPVKHKVFPLSFPPPPSLVAFIAVAFTFIATFIATFIMLGLGGALLGPLPIVLALPFS